LAFLSGISFHLFAQPDSVEVDGAPLELMPTNGALQEAMPIEPFPWFFPLDSVKVGDAVASSHQGYPLSLWLDENGVRKKISLVRGTASNRPATDMPLAAYGWPTAYGRRGWLSMTLDGQFYWVGPHPQDLGAYGKLYSWSAYPFLDSLPHDRPPAGFYRSLSTNVIPTGGLLYTPIAVKIRIPDSELHMFYLIYKDRRELIPYTYRQGDVYTWVVSPGQRAWLFGYEPNKDSDASRFLLQKIITKPELITSEMELLSDEAIGKRAEELKWAGEG